MAQSARMLLNKSKISCIWSDIPISYNFYLVFKLLGLRFDNWYISSRWTDQKGGGKMKRTILISAIAIFCQCALAEDQNICRDQLLEFLKVDTQLSKIDIKRPLNGVVTRSSIDRLHHKFEVGAPCPLAIGVYQTDTGAATVYVQDPTFTFNPFNHTVGADNSPESCSNSSQEFVHGVSYFEQPDGWHYTYGTEIRVQKNDDSTFSIYYGETENSGPTQYAECHGQL